MGNKKNSIPSYFYINWDAYFKKIIYNMNKNYYYYFLIYFISCNPSDESARIEDIKMNDLNASKSNPISYFIKSEFKHDETSFTEGLVFHNSLLFESTGSPDELPETRSIAGPVNLNTGKILTKVNMAKYFGEGITFLNKKLYFLTYKTKIGFVYDDLHFQIKDSFPISSKEGWGLTTDGTHLIMSDGSNSISYINPENFKIIKVLTVSENGVKIDNLNELEYIRGYIYANIFTTYRIVKIDPKNGEVIGHLNLSNLGEDAKKNSSKSLEMNGIAFDSLTNRVFVTGKMWPKIYEIEFQK